MTDQTKQHHGDGEIDDLETEDANTILTSERAEGAGPGPDEQQRSAILGGDRNEASPGGIRDSSAAGVDLPQTGAETARSPSGEPSGGVQEGSLGAATYNDDGRIVGPDSPAGRQAHLRADGDAQGDELADRLGGGEGRGTGLNGAGSGTGDASAGRSAGQSEDRAARGIGEDPGGPGGMGGSRTSIRGSSRPPGGESPLGERED